MRRALTIAAEGWGQVAPNPMVGAIIVRGDEVVGEGYHARWGGPHAEVVALEAAGAKARGSTLYVTLEPCSHVGKTGPCTVAIQEAGIARVVCAASDPHPKAGGGGARLRRGGIEFVSGVCEQEARDLNAIYFASFQRDRPFLALKYAMSLDARLSEVGGAPTRVTAAEAVAETHRLRAGHDALMVGIGTVLADDPQLTVREWRAPRIAPTRVVLDSALRTPADSRLARSAGEVPVLVFAARDAPAQRESQLAVRGIEVERVPRSSEGPGVDLGSVLDRLWKRGIRSVLCEGGGRVGSALIAAGHVSRLYAFIAPRLFGEAGVPAFRGERRYAPRDWRLIRRAELGSTTLLALAPQDTPDL